MKLRDNIQSAWISLRGNKMRTFLTMLGIIIGIAAVIGIMTLGNSLRKSIMGDMTDLGAHNITIAVQQRTEDADSEAATSKSSQDEDQQNTQAFMQMMAGTSSIDKNALISDAMLKDFRDKYKSEISSVGISETGGSTSIIRDGKRANVTVTGIRGKYMEIQSVKMSAGEALSRKDESEKRAEAVVSDQLAEKLFGSSKKAVGQSVSFEYNGKTWTLNVKGVYRYEMQGGDDSGQSAAAVSTELYIPDSLCKDIYGLPAGYSSVTIRTKDSVNSKTFLKKAVNYLNKKYYDTNEDFEISGFSMESLIETMNRMIHMIELVLAGIAGISLLVGGIGVMNIMLVSVTERTREIGIRKALGATNRSIRMQFIVESLIVCLIGGIFGILLGFALGAVGTHIAKIPASVSLSSIVIAVGFSFAIGIFFGLYPANRAAKMEPLDALRYE